MQHHLEQAKHNEFFLSDLEVDYPTTYFDWKVTVSFYIALHYLQALGDYRNIEIGETHNDIERNVNPNSSRNPVMRISNSAWRNYKSLFKYSQIARYDGINDRQNFEELRESDYLECKTHLENFKKYIKSQGLMFRIFRMFRMFRKNISKRERSIFYFTN